MRPLGCENPLPSPHLHLIDQLNDWFSSSFSCSDSDGSRSTKRMDGNILTSDMPRAHGGHPLPVERRGSRGGQPGLGQGLSPGQFPRAGDRPGGGRRCRLQTVAWRGMLRHGGQRRRRPGGGGSCGGGRPRGELEEDDDGRVGAPAAGINGHRPLRAPGGPAACARCGCGPSWATSPFKRLAVYCSSNGLGRSHAPMFVRNLYSCTSSQLHVLIHVLKKINWICVITIFRVH